jgi:hypothetical protein
VFYDIFDQDFFSYKVSKFSRLCQSRMVIGTLTQHQIQRNHQTERQPALQQPARANEPPTEEKP